MFAQTPQPPYTAVIFTSILSRDTEGYMEAAKEMEHLAKIQDGYLGIESARDDLGITVSYWRDEDCAQRWKHVMEHEAVQQIGRQRWYQAYKVRIATVNRAY